MEPSDKVSKQVCCSSSSISRGCSKAQMCLKKIIAFITTNSSAIPSHDVNFESQVKLDEKKQENGLSCGKRGFGVDLNLRLSSCIENGVVSACSGVGEDDSRITAKCSSLDSSTVYKSCEGECDLNSGEGERLPLLSHINTVEDETKESSDITHLEDESQIQAGKRKHEEITVEREELSRRTKYRNEGYLDLLVEAARVISGSFEDHDNDIQKPSQIGRPLETQNEKWVFENDIDISPIVRSKRGRNQVLPSRYRDSVIEPLKKERGATKQRSSSRVSTKSKKKRISRD
ncbi:hypothetical protein ACHQM5_020265 [Ranunculus cassubicifolius]